MQKVLTSSLSTRSFSLSKSSFLSCNSARIVFIQLGNCWAAAVALSRPPPLPLPVFLLHFRNKLRVVCQVGFIRTLIVTHPPGLLSLVTELHSLSCSLLNFPLLPVPVGSVLLCPVWLRPSLAAEAEALRFISCISGSVYQALIY